MTRKQRVLSALRMERLDPLRNDGWVPGHHLTHPSIGGSEGLRRLRELREDGHVIEMRKKPGRTTREYRLVEEAQR